MTDSTSVVDRLWAECVERCKENPIFLSCDRETARVLFYQGFIDLLLYLCGDLDPLGVVVRVGEVAREEVEAALNNERKVL